jgi:phosphomannomutase
LSEKIKKVSKSEDVKRKEIESLKKEYFKQIEAHTPAEIRGQKIFDLKNPAPQKIRVTKDLIKKWHLKEWLANYKKEAEVSTGGIRGPQNVLYPWDFRYPLNELGVALATLGKAMVLKEDITDREINKICSGEVRYNTNNYITLINRIQAAQGLRTHNPYNKQRTSIWMTSFLIFMLDYDGGEYVTSSHAISSKIATKDLDNQGSQFIPEMSKRFVNKIQEILETAEKEGFDIELDAEDSPLIVEDFDGYDLYVDYLRRGIATDTNLDLIKRQTGNGLEIMYECVGGCMYNIMVEITKRLGIENAFVWNNAEEDPFFHGVGKTMENPVTKNMEFFDYGCDTTIEEVTKTMGYERLLRDKPEGYMIIMVDPDGDRIVVGQIEPMKRKGKIEALGIPYIILDNKRLFTYYTPNQSFFLTLDFHASQLKNAGLWNAHPRFIITTTPSAASWVEWAQKNGVSFIYVPVGFKEIANVMKKVEKQIQEYKGDEVKVHDIFGNLVNLGIQPRLLFAGEESGGMITGPEELIRSKKGRVAIAMREKSAGEASVIVTAMAAKLYNDKKLLSDYLEEIFEKYDIKRRYDIRKEVRFYNESNPDPEELKKEKAAGEIQRDKTDKFFLSIALSIRNKKLKLEQAKEILSEALPELDFTNLNNIFFVGDGTYFDFSDKYVEIRKSGTDAIIKSYSAGENKKNCIAYAQTIAKYDGALTPKFKKWISMEIYETCQEKGIEILREFQRGD